MKSSPRRGIEVFDFDEDEEAPEQFAGKYSAKLEKHISDGLAALTPSSLKCVAPSTAVQSVEIASVACVDVNSIDGDPSCGVAPSRSSLDKVEECVMSMNECPDGAQQAKPDCPDECSGFRLADHLSQSLIYESEKRCSDVTCSSLVQMHLNRDNPDSPSSSEAIDVTSDVDEGISESSSLSSPGIPDNNVMLNGYSMDHCSDALEMDATHMAVVFNPDYVIYGDRYCAGPLVTFSNSSIRITGSTAYENQETFDFEWGINDLVKIECQWIQRVETVMMKLRVIPKDDVDDDGSHHTSGIEELKIFIVESNWSQKQQDILSLHPAYLAVWDVMHDSDMIIGTGGDDSPRQERYFPVFAESFEDVIYPKGDIDAVSISKRDVDLLQPETFVNDTIIDFYINYLKNQIQPEERRRFHFFNSFFFRKLADLDKDPSSASDGKAAFQRVRKWTRKVDLFGKEFVFIPVNFSLHWSLIVICHPGAVPTFKDDDLDKSAKIPCILHMDSIKGNHAGLKNIIQSYLWEEWKERQKETSEEVSSKFLNLRFVPLELPQQENSFDCGLFLLHYLEIFLAEVPAKFSPFKIEKSSNFLNSNWFPPTEASLKRALIQRLISELLQNHSEETPSPPSDEDQILEGKTNGVGSEFHSVRFNAGPTCQQNNMLSSQSGQGIELTLLSASSLKNTQCISDSGLVLRDLFNPGTSSGSLMGQCESFDKKSSYYRSNGATSHLEEDPDTGEQFMFEEAGFNQHQLTGISSQTCDISYPSKEYGRDTFDMGISLKDGRRDIDCSSEPSACDSDDSSDVAITEPFPAVEHSIPRIEERIGERSPSLENFECAKEVLAFDSQYLPDKVSLKENLECSIEGLVSASHKPADTPGTAEADVSALQDSVVAGHGIGIHEVQMVGNSLVDSNSHGLKPADNEIGLGHNIPVEGGMMFLNSSGQKLAGNSSIRLGEEQQSEDNMIGMSDNVQMVDDKLAGTPQTTDDGLVGVESLRKQQVNSGIGFSGNMQIDNGLMGPESPIQQQADNTIGLVGNLQTVDDQSADPELPGQDQNDNIINLEYVQIMDVGLVGSDLPRQEQSENWIHSCGNLQRTDSGLEIQNSLQQQPADNAIDSIDGVQTIDNGLLAPHSPSQHLAKRPRLSPSVEDGANVTESLTEDSQP